MRSFYIRLGLGIFALVGAIVGIVGIILWVGEVRDEKNYRGPVPGKVEGGGTYEERCSEEHCSGSTDKQKCHTSYYTCYRAYWEVSYTAKAAPAGDGDSHEGVAQSSSTYSRQSSADSERRSKYKKGSTYPVWYDTTNYNKLRWSEPNALPFFLMWVIGFSVMAPFLLAMLIFFLVKANLIPQFRSGYSSI